MDSNSKFWLCKGVSTVQDLIFKTNCSCKGGVSSCVWRRTIPGIFSLSSFLFLRLFRWFWRVNCFVQKGTFRWRNVLFCSVSVCMNEWWMFIAQSRATISFEQSNPIQFNLYWTHKTHSNLNKNKLKLALSNLNNFLQLGASSRVFVLNLSLCLRFAF